MFYIVYRSKSLFIYQSSKQNIRRQHKTITLSPGRTDSLNRMNLQKKMFQDTPICYVYFEINFPNDFEFLLLVLLCFFCQTPPNTKFIFLPQFSLCDKLSPLAIYAMKFSQHITVHLVSFSSSLKIYGRIFKAFMPILVVASNSKFMNGVCQAFTPYKICTKTISEKWLVWDIPSNHRRSGGSKKKKFRQNWNEHGWQTFSSDIVPPP